MPSPHLKQTLTLTLVTQKLQMHFVPVNQNGSSHDNIKNLNVQMQMILLKHSQLSRLCDYSSCICALNNEPCFKAAQIFSSNKLGLLSIFIQAMEHCKMLTACHALHLSGSICTCFCFKHLFRFLYHSVAEFSNLISQQVLIHFLKQQGLVWQIVFII